jgi:hypothetical protein
MPDKQNPVSGKGTTNISHSPHAYGEAKASLTGPAGGNPNSQPRPAVTPGIDDKGVSRR